MTVASRRAVMVYRPTPLTELVSASGSLGLANFRMASHSNRVAEVASGSLLTEVDALNERHDRWARARAQVLGVVPSNWRQTTVERAELAHFPFEPDDIVIVFGQDGLVANTAKYLDGQPVIGLNPEPGVNPGVLVPHAPERAEELIRLTAEGHVEFEERTMVHAETDDGRHLYALNEVFIGHRSHQSARYRIALDGYEEHQSSSGLIVTTGTGATGWARSIYQSRHPHVPLPEPTEQRLTFFVREAWPSPATQTELVEGVLVDGVALEVTSELNDGGVIFGDGIEQDFVDFEYGMVADVGVADRRLMLVR